MLVEQDLRLQVLPNAGWDVRIEVVQVGELVRSHLIYTEKFTVVYDTLLGPLSGDFLAQRASKSGKPVLVVNSHADWDHYWGNQCFSAPILGLKETAQRISGSIGAAELAKKQSEHDSYVAVKLVAPDLQFEGEFTLDGGDLRLEFLHTPGHRPDHLSLYLPQIKTLLPGDAVETPFALLDEDLPSQALQQMQSSLSRLLSLEVDWLLCNHAPPQAGRALLQANLQYYRDLLLKAGLSNSLESLLQQFPFPGCIQSQEESGEPNFYFKEHVRICQAAWRVLHP